MNRLFVRDLPSVSLSSYLQGRQRCVHLCHGKKSRRLTIVALSDAILDSPPLSQVRDFGPVFIWVGTGTESTAGTSCCSVLRVWRWGPSMGIGECIMVLHTNNGLQRRGS